MNITAGREARLFAVDLLMEIANLASRFAIVADYAVVKMLNKCHG